MVIREFASFSQLFALNNGDELNPDLIATSDYFDLRYADNVEKKCFAFWIGDALVGTVIVRIRSLFTVRLGIINDSICFKGAMDPVEIQRAINLLRKELFRNRVMICFWRTAGLGKIRRGFVSVRISNPSMKTGLIDLRKTEQILLSNCKGKWRNTLRKSESFGYPVEVCETKDEFYRFIAQYEQFQVSKGFKGIKSDFLKRLFDGNSKGTLVPILYKIQSGNADAYLLAIRALGKCTYCVGITNDVARKHQLNSLLLWRSILDAKKDGCKVYDLGGITTETPSGIKKFKLGTNPFILKSDGDYVSIL